MNVNDIKILSEKIQAQINRVIIGQETTVKFVTAALFAGGHVLLEDVPGSGKTTLAKTLGRTIDGTFSRIQMTPDLLPADMTGVNYFNMKTQEFQFLKGPVFANVLIADEINRATPKTQSGLLECMEEKQVTVDGTTYPLDDVFLVIATQNPVESQGVFPLPEAQIDRFLVRLNMNYPQHDEIVQVLRTHVAGSERRLAEVEKTATTREIAEARTCIRNIFVQDDILSYVVDIVEETRHHAGIILGVSQRGALSLVRMSQVLAAFDGRDYVLPDDVKEAAVPVLAHRLALRYSEQAVPHRDQELVREILERVAIPVE
ncbi:MAG: MoxR family ATPase [Lachnospiraceae bacterium]|nr:MoxR family ATPase [Lachnospiraceae bacterium]